jgi:ADP-heptose:LPS heptosyltransferase
LHPRFLKNLEHRFKDALQSAFRLFLRDGDPSRCPVDPARVESILVLRQDKLGDMVASLPALHALKSRYPGIRLEVLASPANAFLVTDDPQVDEVHLYTKNILRDWGTIRRLRDRRFSIVYDPICHDSVTGLLLTRLIGNGAVAVASRKLRLQRYYDFCRPYEPDGTDHNYDNGLLIFEALGDDPAAIDPFQPLYLPPAARAKAAAFIESLPDGSHLWVGLNISAGSSTRTLPLEKYARIVAGIVDLRPEARFVVSCTPAERKRGRDLVHRIGDRAHLVPDNLSLLEVSAILDQLAQVVISPDTSLVHIARLFKIPVVGLYSGHRRNFNFWRPYRQRYGAVVARAEGNLHDIEADEVVNEFRRLLESLEVDEKTIPERRS